MGTRRRSSLCGTGQDGRHGPVFEPATLHGIGPRVAEPAVGLNSLLYFAAPYEEMRLKKP